MDQKEKQGKDKMRVYIMSQNKKKRLYKIENVKVR